MQVERPRIQVRSGLLIAGKDHPKSVHNQPSSTDQDRDQSLVCYISSSEDEEDPLVAFHGNVHTLLAASEDALAEPQDEVICIEEEDGPSLAVSSECIPVVLDNELEDSYVKEVKDCVETVTTSKPGSPLQPVCELVYEDSDVKELEDCVAVETMTPDMPLQPPPPRAQLFMCKRCPRQFCLKDNLIKHRRTQHKRCVYVLATCCVAPSA